MATELKEIIMHLRKGVMFSVRISYRSARAHPYISGMLVFLLILSKGFPYLFALLISSFPVLVCTAILLGTLLSYGKPNIPEIEQEDRTVEISSLKVGSIDDDVVIKKDERFTAETLLGANMGVNERAVEDALGKASNSSIVEIERDVPSVKAHDEGIRMDDTVLSTSLLLQKDDNTLHGGMKVSDEREVEGGFVNKREFDVEVPAELVQQFDADHIVATTDQNELEGLTVQIANTTSESPFDSSLGSPWHAVDTCDASCSDSDGAESSSPDASMADIIPMLDELHPLLDSEDHQLTFRTFDNSDAASSGSSEDHESDTGVTEDEAENKDADKESQEREAANEATVPWTADDQKNVMDLGYSEAERNRRLENLIARRRLRKLQRFETQKNLIDLDSLYPSSIPSISAPRRNPFDLPYDSYGDVNLPPIPGSAPSVLQPRKNPFDLPGDQVDELSTLSTEYLSHHDFVSAAQRGMLSRRHENSMAGPSFSGDFNQEGKQSTLNQCSVSQQTDSDVTGFTAFERQLTPKSDPKVCTIPGSGNSQYTGQHDHELTEPEMHQGSIMLTHVDQDRRSIEASDSFDNEHEQNRMDVDTDHAIDFITSIAIKETHQTANTVFDVLGKEHGEVEDNLTVSDTGKLETIEDRYVDSISSSLQANEKISEVNIHGKSSALDQTRDDTRQSDRVDGAQSADIFPDSSSSAIIKTLSNIATPDEVFLYGGMDNVIPTYSPADVQAESLGVASPPRQFEANLLEDQNLVVARSEEDLASAIGELLVESSNLSVDENESRPMKISEINEHDAVKVGISETSGDVHPSPPELPDSMAGQIMHSSSSSSMDSELSWNQLVTADKSNLSEGNDLKELPSADESVTYQSLEAVVPESLVTILSLPSKSDENFDDSHLEERRTSINSPESSCLTASQVAEESNARKSAVEDIGEDDFGIGLVPEGIKGDDSVAFPINQTHDGCFPGPRVFELTASTEFSTPLKMKSENEMSSNNDSNDSQSNIIDEILSNQEVRILKDLDNSDKESDDRVHAEVSGIKDIDEGFLSELDAVGDFRVKREPKWDQEEGYGAEPGQFDSVLEGTHPEIQDISTMLQDMDDSVIPLGVISDAKFSYSDKVSPVIDEPNSVKPQVSSSLLPSEEDPEMTLYNSKLPVLEPCSIEEIDSVFKKHHAEAVMHPALDSTVESSITSTSEEDARELDIATSGQEPSGSDAELLVLDAISVEDISSALKKFSEGLDKPSIADVEMPDVLPEGTHSEPEEIHSDLHVAEAGSLDDVNVALKQLSEVSVESPPVEMELKDGHTEAETSQRLVEPEIADVHSSEASEEHIQTRHVEVEPPEEIQISPVQIAAMQMNTQQSSEKSDGITSAGDVSGPRDPTSE